MKTGIIDRKRGAVGRTGRFGLTALQQAGRHARAVLLSAALGLSSLTGGIAGTVVAVGASLGAASVATPAFAAASPTVDQVEAAIARGDMREAQSLLDQVVAAHPGSARAHYLDAQVLERNRQYAQALDQIHAARNIDPAIGFTDRRKFETVQRRIESEAGRAGAAASERQPSTSSFSGGVTPSQSTAPVAAAALAAEPTRHGPSSTAWILLIIVLAAVVALVVWGMRRRRQLDDEGEVETHRDDLKQATSFIETVRAMKLDPKLSTAADKQTWIAEAEDVEARLRDVIDGLSASGNGGAHPYAGGPQSQAPYQLEELTHRVERIKAFSEGRPIPADMSNRSPYADEADRLSRPLGTGFGANGQPQYPQQPYQQPPQQVIVQQPGGLGGMGGGLGGLLGGVLLGEALSGHRERDVIVEHDRDTNTPQQDAGGGFDFGNGGDNWGGGDGGQIDAGNDDNNWDDT